MASFFGNLLYYSGVSSRPCETFTCHIANIIENDLKNPETTKSIARIGNSILSMLNDMGESAVPIKEKLENFAEGMSDIPFAGFKNFKTRYMVEILPYIIAGGAISVAVPLAIKYVYHKVIYNIGRPKLATEYQVASRFSFLLTPISLPFSILTYPARALSNRVKKIFFEPSPSAIFNQDISRRIGNIVNDLKNIIKNKGYLQNVLLYGPPGTGKTMISKIIAKQAGVNYVLMSGGDLPQYIKRGEAVTELNRLIDVAEKAPGVTIIFIDEAEGLCRSRDKLSQEMLELQNAFLNRTGTQSKKVMLVLATNRKDDLDSAILNRMDYKINIGTPGFQERAKIIQMYAKQFCSKRESARFFNSSICNSLAVRMSGMTGRQMHKVISSIYNRKCATKKNTLSNELIRDVTSDFIWQEINENNNWIFARINYLFKEIVAAISGLTHQR